MSDSTATTVKPIYQHTQIGYVSLIIIALVLVWYAWKFRRAPNYSSVDNVSGPLMVYLPVVIAVIMGMFITLTVRITPHNVSWLFGPGLIRGGIEVSDIAQARTVETSLLTGFGIRHTASGVLYNVSGTGAVEFRLQNGGQVKLGTDDATGMLAALRQAGVQTADSTK